jgi:hypothetical protein
MKPTAEGNICLTSLKKVDPLTSLIFNFDLHYTIRWVQVNQDGLKLNGTNLLVSNDDDVNILG